MKQSSSSSLYPEYSTQVKEKMQHQKWIENKENEARQEIFNTHNKVMDGSLKSKISSCSEDNCNTEEDRMDPMLLKEREAANFLAQHADMVRNGTWKKMKEEEQQKKKEQERMKQEEEERKRKEEATLKQQENHVESPVEQETKSSPEIHSQPPRRKILRFLCCTVVEESY